jgi:shikimate dehydrogenase
VKVPAAFVAGWPVSHSRSPLIHRFWLKRYDIAGDYRPEAVPPHGFAEFAASIASKGYIGGNVTIPHKEAAFRACDATTPVARSLGAVNTLWLQDGTLYGDNTDVFGFTANLDETAPDWRAARTALVLGAGGAARGVVRALLDAGVDSVTVLNRTPERARDLALAAGQGARGGGLDELDGAFGAAGIVVNATPAGMDGAAGFTMDWSCARRDAIAVDIVYVPIMTPFLAGAAAAGLRIVDGLGMLLHQAAPGFERWFGRRPAVDAELRRAVLADLGE